MNTVPKRETVPTSYQWNLTDLYESTEQWDNDVAEVKEMLPTLRSFSGKLLSPEHIKECFELSDRISRTVEKLYSHAHLKHHEDTSDVTHQGRVTTIKQLSVEVSEAMSFIEPELLAQSEEQLLKAIEDPELSFYRFTLENMLRQKPHTLRKDEEALLAKAGVMAQTPQTIFSMLNNADLKFPTITDEQGDEIELTHARYGRFMESRDRRVRKEAFHAMFGSYMKQKNTIASIFNANVEKNIFFARSRQYRGTLDMALFSDNIPPDVYSNLIETIHQGLPVFHRYLNARKKILQLEELHMYDLNVPLVPDFDWKITYDESKKIINEALAPLGHDYIQIVQQAWESGWIDVYENQGKHNGAYSWGVYRIHPFILLNHEDRLDDLFTIAHEMGHALHSYFSDQHQEFRYAGYSIFIAEIASTLNEALLMNYLLQQTTDFQQLIYLLTHYADNFRATVFVQTLFAEFEKEIHEAAERGVPLTLDTLNETYYRLHERYYGDSVILDEEVKFGWMRIPHFYNSFYVFKYATGFSAANSFSHRILQKGGNAVEQYLELLKSGGKDYPLNLLKHAGLDMTQPTPIVEALSAFENVVSQLEGILTQQNESE
ncbi:MAG: oligoendopeptidase F [Ignavibacteria bacterium]|nr:oligoendopeptidase F [Ignavibacteria bacterium]